MARARAPLRFLRNGIANFLRRVNKKERAENDRRKARRQNLHGVRAGKAPERHRKAAAAARLPQSGTCDRRSARVNASPGSRAKIRIERPSGARGIAFKPRTRAERRIHQHRRRARAAAAQETANAGIFLVFASAAPLASQEMRPISVSMPRQARGGAVRISSAPQPPGRARAAIRVA